MHCSWLNGIKILSMLIILLSLSSNHVKAAPVDVDDYGVFQGDLDEMNEAVKRASGWQNLQGGWGKRNVRNNKITDYVDQGSVAADFASPVRNYEYDTSKVDANDDANVPVRPWEFNNADNLASKRSRGGNWNNLKNTGWGKREPGNWNNLRGLWGKRSSWGRLNGSWGRK